MTCTRCQGHMTADHFIDMQESGGEWWTDSWRCINCGYVLDPVLEQNRRKHRAALVAAAAPAQSAVEHRLARREQVEFDLAA